MNADLKKLALFQTGYSRRDLFKVNEMQIKNKKYYHIHRAGPHSTIWKVGRRINWVRRNPNIFNSFYDTFCVTTDNTNGNGSKYFLSAMDCFRQQPPVFQQSEVFKYLDIAYTVIKEHGTFIRETIFEEVRNSYFPQLPSRKTCIWVCETNAVEYWWDKLDAKEKYILELNLTGTMHHADQRHLVHDTIDHDTLRSFAFQYWTGTEGDKTIEEEVLFEGVIDILNSFKNITEFKHST